MLEHGPLSLEERMVFMSGAQHEVLEIGVGLKAFVDDFEGDSSAEWMKFLVGLLEKGVSIKCAALDPDWQGTAFYLKDRNEFDYLEQMYKAARTLRRQRDALGKFPIAGSFTLAVYRHLPSMHVVCVDIDDAELGRMLVAHYLYGAKRSEAPVFQFSRRSNPELFENYVVSIRELTQGSKRVF